MKTLKEAGLTEAQAKRILAGRKPKPKILPIHITEKTFLFGVVSDTHLCSTHEKLDELHTFYSVCAGMGVRHILHAGDILDGSGHIYRGQLNNIHTYGATKQVAYVVKNYPKFSGITTHFILGNHDTSFFNDNGIDVGGLISAQREDMKYLGQYSAEMVFQNVRVRIVHPLKAAAYSISYHPQRFVEQIQSGKKPHLIFFGHSHTALYFFHRNVHVFQAGAFQSQTDLELRLGLNPAIGGWIVKLHLGEEKSPVTAITPTFLPFFEKGNGR